MKVTVSPSVTSWSERSLRNCGIVTSSEISAENVCDTCWRIAHNRNKFNSIVFFLGKRSNTNSWPKFCHPFWKCLLPLISYTMFICESLKHAKVILKGGMATIHKIGENVCNWEMWGYTGNFMQYGNVSRKKIRKIQ